jgi:NodT family efflux transporter outer membrane factor (OMF) lipoprotein
MWAISPVKSISVFTGVGLLLMLGACAFLDDPEKAEDTVAIPDSWQASVGSAAPVDDDWLHALGVPELEALVAESLQNNADLRATAARLQQAGLQASIERGSGYPTVDLSLGAQRDRSHLQSVSGGRDPVYVSEHTLTLDVAWELDVWGEIRAAAEAADADFTAAQHDYAAARVSLAAQTAQLLIDLSATGMQRDLATKRVNSFKDTVQRVRSRYHRGLTTAFDLRLAESDLATARTDLAERADQLAKAARALEIVLGRYPGNEIDGLRKLPKLGNAIPAGLPAALLERRPDLVAERARLLAAGYRIKAARAELLPRISLTASGGASSNEFRNLFDADYLIASIAANLVQPIFRGGRLRDTVALNRAREKEQIGVYAGRVLIAFKEVEDALDAERWLTRQLEALVEALAQADAAEDLARAQYQRGLTEVLELLTAQRRRLDAEERLLDVRRQRVNNRIALHLTLGGDFGTSRASRHVDQRGTR